MFRKDNPPDEAEDEEESPPLKLHWETESDTVEQLVKVIDRQMTMIEDLHTHLKEQNEALLYILTQKLNR
jgi:hypothetical protein